MDVSLRWLRELAPGISDDLTTLAAELASRGAPVEGVVEIGARLAPLRIARVVEVRKHPNADRLSLCQVDVGADELISVVCGAPNVRADRFYPYIPVGATLPGGMRIEKRKIRGEWSRGMLCSPREIELGRDHDGLLELRGEYEPGASFIEAVGLDDTRITIEVTPNRGDLLSHVGVARELAPEGEAGIRLPAFDGGRDLADTSFVVGVDEVVAGGASVRVEDPAGCPIYTAAVVRGVRVGPSPEWLATRLRALGARPINNVVDATNYVLQELGQPMHAFDLDRLQDGIVVRRARAGETIRTLDGVDRKLEAGMLVIADTERPVALAGVMGGEETEVREGTTNVLLETAIFDPRAVRATRQGFDLSTDASYRFERGVDPDGVERAVRRAVALILATAGGQASTEVACVQAEAPTHPTITLRLSRLRQALGIDVTVDAVTELLTPIGFAVSPEDDETVLVSVPGHRSYDVTREDDLVEEVARRHGYEQFPSELRPFRPSSVPDDPMARLEDRLRSLLVGRGLLEARGSPFAPEADGDIALLRPLSAAESKLRRDLTPGLLRRIESNHNRGERDVRLFEIGTAFGAPIGTESTRLAAVLTGARAPEHWSGSSGDIEVWDVAGLLDSLRSALDVGFEPLSDAADGAPWIDPAEAFRISNLAGDTLGWAGRVREDAVDAPPWAGAHYSFELIISQDISRAPPTFAELHDQPAVERDLALIVADKWPAGIVAATIGEVGAPLLQAVHVFDVYRGGSLPKNTRSLAFRLRFRATDRTLTDDEVDRIVGRVLDQLRERYDVEQR